MLDFASSPVNEAFVAGFNALIDGAWKAKRDQQPSRDYLGGSRLGVECLRQLGYEYHNEPRGNTAYDDPDEGVGFSGRLYRIFERGHMAETRMALYLREAGFSLTTEKANGHQFGFGVCPHPETGRPRIAGHIDGALTAGPAEIAGKIIPYPALWEHKGVNQKAYAKYMSKGIREGNYQYFIQMQIYMAYMDLKFAVFTAENQNTCEVYVEIVPFDLREAQRASDRGITVIESATPLDLPRVAKDQNDYRCKMCSFAGKCWAVPSVKVVTANPAWLPGGARV